MHAAFALGDVHFGHEQGQACIDQMVIPGIEAVRALCHSEGNYGKESRCRGCALGAAVRRPFPRGRLGIAVMTANILTSK